MSTRQRWYLAFALAALAGLAIGAAWPPPPIPKNQDDAGNWTLPAAGLERMPRSAPDEAGRIRWFGDQTGSDGQSAQDWRLAGVLMAPGPVALVTVAPAPAQGRQKPKPGRTLRLEAGSALPDGGRLEAIENDTITVELDGCRSTYQLHRPKPVRTTGTCNAEPAVAEQRKSR